jgi:hypothetical protein
MKKGYLYNPNTYTSYYLFSLCLLAPPSTAALRTLVIIWLATAVGVQAFPKKGKRRFTFLSM